MWWNILNWGSIVVNLISAGYNIRISIQLSKERKRLAEASRQSMARLFQQEIPR